MEVTEKADAADAVPFIKTETAPNFPGGKDKLTEFVNKNISFPESTYVNGILDMDAVVQLHTGLQLFGQQTAIKLLKNTYILSDTWSVPYFAVRHTLYH